MLQCWGRFSRLRSVVRVSLVGVGGLGCIGFRAPITGLGVHPGVGLRLRLCDEAQSV